MFSTAKLWSERATPNVPTEEAPLWTYVEPVLEHWLSSGFSGLLAYSSTSIICRFWFYAGSPRPPRTSSITPADRSIGRLSLSAGFTAALASHLYIDFVAGHGWLG